MICIKSSGFFHFYGLKIVFGDFIYDIEIVIL